MEKEPCAFVGGRRLTGGTGEMINSEFRLKEGEESWGGSVEGGDRPGGMRTRELRKLSQHQRRSPTNALEGEKTLIKQICGFR